jgi:hypothetical protein
MFYYTYKITEKETGKFYIGARGSKKDPLLDLGIKYFSSSRNLKSIIFESGIESFIFEIIKDSYKSWKEAYDDEQSMIFDNWENPLKMNKACYYMKKDFGIISEDSKKRISKKSLEMWADEEKASNIIEKQKESWSDERRERNSEMMKSKWTEERRKNHSEKLKGHAGSKKLKGIKKPEGFGEKISERLKGVKKSEDHKKKLSEARKGKIYPHLRKLSSKDIKEIQEKITNGQKISNLSKEYSVSLKIIYSIRNGILKP